MGQENGVYLSKKKSLTLKNYTKGPGFMQNLVKLYVFRLVFFTAKQEKQNSG
jgi:hypothetical protein